MRPTHQSRKIDDLGRVVIPKDIRKQLNINDGDLLDIFIYNEDTVCYRKHGSLSDMLFITDQLRSELERELPEDKKDDVLSALRAFERQLAEAVANTQLGVAAEDLTGDPLEETSVDEKTPRRRKKNAEA